MKTNDLKNILVNVEGWKKDRGLNGYFQKGLVYFQWFVTKILACNEPLWNISETYNIFSLHINQNNKMFNFPTLDLSMKKKCITCTPIFKNKLNENWKKTA